MRGDRLVDIVNMTHQLAGSLPRSSPLTVHTFSHFLPQSSSSVALLKTVDDLRPEDRPATEIMAREKFGANVRLTQPTLLSSIILTRVLSLFLLGFHFRCDAEPGALADYILALLKHNAAESELRVELGTQLEEFLEKGAVYVHHSLSHVPMS